MILSIPVNDKRHVQLKHEVDDACKKFSKYFLSLPSIQCRISCSKGGYKVKMMLKTGGKKFISERLGPGSVPCINSVVDSILRMIERGGKISLFKGDKVNLDDIELRCRTL